MQNLLKETVECLNENGREPSDVLWVGRRLSVYTDELYKSTWEDFCCKANFYYDDGFGCNEIPTDLVVVGKDFWLERHEYDGSEWWEFKALPTEPSESRELDLDLPRYY